MNNFLVTLGFILSFASASAQYCLPIGNCTARDYIDNFEFNTISNMGSAGTNCGTFQNPGNAYNNTGLSTTVTQGQTYLASMRGRNNGRAQGFGVWIDLNQDNDFDDPGEFVLANSAPTNSTFSDSITIPYSCKPGTTRLRVRSLRNSAITSTQSCATFNRGESEDYILFVQSAPIPPLVDFKANTTFSCNGVIQFTDLTPNSVTSWLWDFGNGDTSTQQNPLYTYTSSGSYTVKLTTTNNFGTTDKSKANYITVNVGSGPINAQCTPSTSTSAAGFGITSFSFVTLNQTSADATTGYEDFSCNQTNATQGQTYRMRFGSTTAPANQNFRAWIDYNGDGVFSNQELVVNQDNKMEADQLVTIPATSNTGTALRIRLAAVYYLNAPAGSNFTACSALQNGQMEDYNVKITANTSGPASKFSVNSTKSCDGTVHFTDQSTNLPTNWKWDFGDGNTSTVQNPSHTYAASGSYTVKLTVTNNFGADSITKTSHINVDLSLGVKAACPVQTNNHIDDYGIHYVIFSNINNITSDGSDGYMDYSCSHQINVNESQAYTLEIKTGTLNKEDVKAWIDYDNDGQFASNEMVMNSLNKNLHSESITISPASVKYTPLRMRITSDIVGTNPGSCDDANRGQTEDYGIIIAGDTNSSSAPAAGFVADSTQSCTGVIKFTDQSSNSPSSWNWDFGDGNTSILQNPTHTYASVGSYTVSLVSTNSFGNDTETKTSYIDVDEIYCGTTSTIKFDHSAIKIYPNPSEGLLFIDFPDHSVKKYTLRLISLQGQVIYLETMNAKSGQRTELDLSEVGSGMFLLELESSETRIVKQIRFN